MDCERYMNRLDIEEAIRIPNSVATVESDKVKMVEKDANSSTMKDYEKGTLTNSVTTTALGDNNGGGSSLEPATRSANALWKRADQLMRWQESETNRENPNPLRGGVAVSWSQMGICRGKVTFPDECIFLAACASGDIDEVDRLLEHGADINTTNVDGMTALHQAVIDQNLDVVQYLVENGADIDAQDNEGWTPLMAGVSCDFMDIVRYLLDKGADPSLVNSDGELPLDLTDSAQMRSVLQQEISRRGLDLEDTRHREEQLMMRDALDLLNSRSSSKDTDKRHPRSGATALHVAAAKGYIKVLNILLQAGSNVNAVDFEGWTPLHAAAHWGERHACEILAEHMADMEALNNAKQTCFDVADSDELCQALEEMKKKQEQMKKDHKSIETLIEPNPSSRQLQEYKVRKNSITRISTDSKKTITKTDETKEAEALRTASSSDASDTEHEEHKSPPRRSADDSSNLVGSVHESLASKSVTTTLERKRQEAAQAPAAPQKYAKLDSSKEQPLSRTTATPTTPLTTVIPTPLGSPLAAVSVTVVQPTRPRQTAAVTSTVASSAITTASGGDAAVAKPAPKTDEAQLTSSLVGTQQQGVSKPHHGPPIIVPSEPTPPPWRLTGRRGMLPTTSSAGGSAVSENGSPLTSSSSSARTSHQSSGVVSVQVSSSTTPTPSKVTMVSAAAAGAPEGIKWRQSPLEKNLSLEDERRHAISEPTSGSPPFRSFVPPQRSEESEAERKVRAKRERESRRSTQGVTLDTIKLAEHIHGKGGAEGDGAGKAGAGSTATSSSEDDKTHSKSPTRGDTVAKSPRRSSKNVFLGETKENMSPPKKSSAVERPATIDIASASKAPTPTTASLYPWKPTRQVFSSENGNDAVAKPDATPTNERAGGGSTTKVPFVASTATAITTTPPFLKRFQASNGASPDERTTSHNSAADSSSISTTAAAATTTAVTSPSASALAAVSAHIPNRKRLRNTRRSTGPVAQEDVQLAAAVENDHQHQQGQMTTAEDENSSAAGAGGDQKPSNTTTVSSKLKTSSTTTVIPPGQVVGNASPMGERKSALNNETSSPQQSYVSLRSAHTRHMKTDNAMRPSSAGATSESNVELDYKKLYEREKSENDRLLEKIKYLENLIESTRIVGVKVGSGGDPGQPLSDRERRTLEKRIAQLEEETKIAKQLQADNQRLKEENGALIRVISKLSK